MNMAEISNDKFVLEVPENEDFILFAEEFVNYMMLLNVPLYVLEIEQLKFRDYSYGAFDKFRKRAVRVLDKCFKMNNEDTFRQIHQNEIASLTTYRRFTDSLALQYFSESFEAKQFLKFCVRISMMAALYYRCGIVNAPIAAKSCVTNILKKYMTADGWNNLLSISREFDNMLRKKGRLAENVHSEEIELNQAEDETSDHESRTSLQSEILNNVPENEETSLIQEHACSKRGDIWVLKCARYCSESSCGKGLINFF